MNEAPASLQQFDRDARWYIAHYEELLHQYPEQWIAVYRESVVGTDADYDKLLDELEEEGVPLSHVFIQRAAVEGEDLILATAG